MLLFIVVMKTNKIKKLHLQAFANELWRDVAEYADNDKREAMSLLKWKKKNNKETTWRLILRTVSEKKIA
jgi:hypothetical protein